MRKTIDTTEIERNAQHLIYTRRQLSALVHADRDRQRTQIGLAGTLIFGIILALVLVVLLTSCIPATPIGRPTPTATRPAPSTKVHQLAPTLLAPTSARTHQIHQVQPTPQRCVVDAGGVAPGTVNLRSGPGMGYPVVATVKEGDELPLYGPQVDGWQQATTPQLVAGWFYVTKWCKEGTK